MVQQVLEQTNHVRIVGVVASETVVRELPNRSRVLQWRVKVADGDGPTVSIPCATDSAPVMKRVEAMPVGTAVALEGSVATRFWMSNGQMGSRVEVRVTHAERCRLSV